MTDARRRIRDFARSELLPHATEWELANAIPPEIVRLVAAEGWLGAPIAAAYGGGDTDQGDWGFLNHCAGTVSSSLRTLLTVSTALVALTIQRWGSADQRTRWLPALASGAERAAFALSEQDSGSDAGAMATTYRREAGSFVLDGEKSWISFGGSATVFMVFATAAQGPACFLIRRESPGAAVTPHEPILGLRASNMATLTLRGCRVADGDLVGRPGTGFAFVANSALDQGRYSVACGAAGLARACLDASLDRALARRQFGEAIASFQLIRQLLVDMAVQVHTAEALCERAGQSRDRRSSTALFDTNIAKYHAARAANDVARAAVQVHGAYGVRTDGPVERHFRDAKILELIEGSNQIQTLMLSDALLAQVGEDGRAG